MQQHKNIPRSQILQQKYGNFPWESYYILNTWLKLKTVTWKTYKFHGISGDQKKLENVITDIKQTNQPCQQKMSTKYNDIFWAC